jgi:hypothetical protein
VLWVALVIQPIHSKDRTVLLHDLFFCFLLAFFWLEEVVVTLVAFQVVAVSSQELSLWLGLFAFWAG